jgi:hypothetical protein
MVQQAFGVPATAYREPRGADKCFTADLSRNPGDPREPWWIRLPDSGRTLAIDLLPVVHSGPFRAMGPNTARPTLRFALAVLDSPEALTDRMHGIVEDQLRGQRPPPARDLPFVQRAAPDFVLTTADRATLNGPGPLPALLW